MQVVIQKRFLHALTVVAVIVLAVSMTRYYKPRITSAVQVPPSTPEREDTRVVLEKLYPLGDTVTVLRGDIFNGRIRLVRLVDSTPVEGAAVIVEIPFGKPDSVALADTHRIVTDDKGAEWGDLEQTFDTVNESGYDYRAYLEADSTIEVKWRVFVQDVPQEVFERRVQFKDIIYLARVVSNDPGNDYLAQALTTHMNPGPGAPELPPSSKLDEFEVDFEIYQDSSLTPKVRFIVGFALITVSKYRNEAPAIADDLISRLVLAARRVLLEGATSNMELRMLSHEILLWNSSDMASYEILKRAYVDSGIGITIGNAEDAPSSADTLFVPAYREGLSSPDNYVRRGSIRALALRGFKDQQIVDIIAAAIRTEAAAHHGSRVAGFYWDLEKIGTDAAAGVIAEAFTTRVMNDRGDEVRAFEALQRMGRLDLVPGPWSGLGDADPRHPKAPRNPANYGPKYMPR